MRSTEEWEAALEGTTEGNWIQAQGVEVWAEGDNGVNVFVGSAYQHNESREDNARLFALAPEAVAEVVRLRRELEELRDHNAYEADLHDDDDQFPEVVTLGKHNASQLTRILGGTNE